MVNYLNGVCISRYGFSHKFFPYFFDLHCLNIAFDPALSQKLL